MTLRLSDAEVKRLDVLRGSVSRSSYLRMLLQRLAVRQISDSDPENESDS